MRITILGAGVSGLTCGVRLRDDGHDVTIVARDMPQQTTSAVAGAVWFPYRVAPNERTGPWAHASYERFAELQHNAPVSMVELTMLYPERLNDEPWWLGAVPGDRVRATGEHELPDGYEDGRTAEVPCIQAPAYLDWLTRRFTGAGGRIEQRTVAALEELPGDAVIDCAGVGATTLAEDPELKPVRGQVAYVKCAAPLRFMVDETGPNALAYVLPRPDVVVLGGTAEEGDDDLTPREHTTKDIVDRCTRLQPELTEATLVGTAVGLRPARPSVRLERDTLSDGRPLIHDYGHGGSGFTLSWGCADEVARIVSGIT
jgi:D-amino-acid oxidase